MVPSLITFLPFSTSEYMHHLSSPNYFPTESKAASQYSLSSVSAITFVNLGNCNNIKSSVIVMNLTSRSGSQELLGCPIFLVGIFLLQNSIYSAVFPTHLQWNLLNNLFSLPCFLARFRCMFNVSQGISCFSDSKSLVPLFYFHLMFLAKYIFYKVNLHY